jgi:hypothetical protein
MTQQFKNVSAGDLIRADLMNYILNKLVSLEEAIGKLTPGDRMEITGLYPPEPLHIGDKLTILGRNFGQPASNTVTMNEAFITEFDAGSDDRQLIFTIPAIEAATEEGAKVKVTVSNLLGFDFTYLKLLEAIQPLDGHIGITPHLSPDVPKIEANTEYLFTFTVRGITTQDETYNLTASVTDDKEKPLVWQTATLDEDNHPASEVKIPKGDTTRDLGVRLRTGAEGSSARLRLTVTSKHKPDFTFTSGNYHSIKVGGEPQPEFKIPIEVRGIVSPGSLTGTALVVPYRETNNTALKLNLRATISKTGDYTITGPSAEDDPNNEWEVILTDSRNFRVDTPGYATIKATIRALKPTAPTTNLLLEITKDDEPDFMGKLTYPISIS